MRVKTKLAPVRDFIRKRKDYYSCKINALKKKSYDIALNEIRPKILAMKRQLQDQYQQLEKEYYQLNKSLAKTTSHQH